MMKKYDLDHPLFQKAMPVMDLIESHGFEVYFVGGCVRDTLLKRTIHDIDIASSARPEEIEAIFNNTVDLGKEHGTIIVIYQGQSFEITTFRTEEGYSDYRRPDSVSFVRNLREDTLRRDFTINAFAFDRFGHLYDYHQGLRDLEDKLIRAVGYPDDRFKEDALRMLRALRFSCQLGFEIESETFKAIQRLAENLKYLSVERIRVEFSKLMMGQYFSDMSSNLIHSGLFQFMPNCDLILDNAWLKELQNWLKPLNDKGLQVCESLVWALFTLFIGLEDKEVRAFLRNWTHSNKLIKDVLAFRYLFPQFIDNNLSLWDIYHYDSHILFELDQVMKANNQAGNIDVSTSLNLLPIRSIKDLKVDGNDILRILNLNQGGPIIGKIMARLEKLVVEGHLNNDYDTLEKFILELED